VKHEPTVKQALALVVHRFVERPDDPVEIFYGGAAGGGKSDWLLMAALQYVDRPDYAAIIFRRTYAQLAKPGALIARAKEWLGSTDAKWNESNKAWRFPSGATLQFGYLEDPTDREDHQSAEYQFVGFDELTHFEERDYTYLFSRLRRTEGQDIPLRQCSASNPGSRGHAWVRDRLVEGSAEAENRVFIPARIEDNEHLDEQAYMVSLGHLSDVLQMQLREGVWDAFEGLAYPMFRKEVHVVPKFEVPAWWARFEGLDHGSANPAAWFLFATDGDGNYLATDGYYSPGMVSDHAKQILARRESALPLGDGGRQVAPTCYADPSIRNRLGVKDWRGREVSVELEYADNGLLLAPGQNDRRAGFSRITELLRRDPEREFPRWHPMAGERGAPRLFLLDVADLEPLIAQLRDAPLEDADNPLSRFPGEAVDFEWEGRHGHAHAAARYALMSRKQAPTEPVRPLDDARAQLLKDHEQRLDNPATTGRYETV
jgi:hypothetical protein